MNENDPGKIDWKEIGRNIDFWRMRADLAVNKLSDNTRYLMCSTSIEREQGILSGAEFAGEAMDFLSSNLSAKLAPIRVSRQQLNNFRFLMASIDSGGLFLKETKGKMWGEKPFVIHSYKTNTQSNDVFRNRRVSFTTRWGLRDPFPHGFAVYGRGYGEYPGSVNFITFPKKMTDSEEVREIMSIKEKQGGFTRRVDVFEEGKRIVLSDEGVYRGEDISMTEQYFLLGAFYGEGTGREYWLYGSNSEIHDKTTRFVRNFLGVTSRQNR